MTSSFKKKKLFFQLILKIAPPSHLNCLHLVRERKAKSMIRSLSHYIILTHHVLDCSVDSSAWFRFGWFLCRLPFVIPWRWRIALIVGAIIIGCNLITSLGNENIGGPNVQCSAHQCLLIQFSTTTELADNAHKRTHLQSFFGQLTEPSIVHNNWYVLEDYSVLCSEMRWISILFVVCIFIANVGARAVFVIAAVEFIILTCTNDCLTSETC